jgi:drug/metabolite transporter (DMT)-like permease
VNRRSWLFLLALASIWGASYMLIKIGLRDLSPAMVAFGRIALASLVLLPLAASQNALRPLRGRVAVLPVLGAVQVAGPFLLISLAERSIASGLAGILVATTPLFTALIALRVDYAERSEGMRLAGVVLGMVGVVVLFAGDLTGSRDAVLGGLAVVLASVGYSVGSFILKRSLPDAPPLGVVAGVMTASAILLLPAAIATLPSQAPAIGPIAALLALGFLGTGIAFVIFYSLIVTVGAARSMLVSYVAPGFAVLYGAAFLSEPVTVAMIAGLLLIVAGSWLGVEGSRSPLAAARGLRGSAPRRAPSEAHPESRPPAPGRWPEPTRTGHEAN